MINKHLLLAAAASALLALAACGEKSTSESEATTATETGEVASEPTQVVARVGGEDITVHQLNVELQTFPAKEGQDPQLVREAVLRAMAFRTAMRQLAEKGGLDKAPQTALMIEAAKDKILADAYLRAQTGSTPPPTDQEIRDFILQYPMQFDERRIYEFTRLTFPVDVYSDLLVPMFDETESFEELETYLKSKSVAYSVNKVSLPSSDFPKPVQDQLVKFGVGDNVVAKAQRQVSILKIEGWTDAPLARDQAEKIAAQVLYQEKLQERAKTIRDNITQEVDVEFKGDFASMKLVENAPDSGAAPADEENEAPAGAPDESGTEPAGQGTEPAPGGETSQDGATTDEGGANQ